MNNPEELTGTIVLVHPDLADDPAQRQGQIGMVTFANLEKDDVYVTFGMRQQSLYSTDALLVLKEPAEIYRDLLTHSKELSTADFKTLFQISLLEEYGQPKSIRTAIEMAMGNEAVRSHSMTSLQDRLGQERKERQEIQQSNLAFRKRG
jgi:hypothetical protein